jgi:hypothetical protein
MLVTLNKGAEALEVSRAQVRRRTRCDLSSL